ncbi:hypothetical protein F2Q69_00008447 [Brassica cretica]|uniref:Uncharacterized protein n=1 Tax=Brassica cretica TaxID=69181 RepID=A0A8S9NY40_BRACR|nr:hypothetical protein F2Q69_00008447 [Brassica cretica]
MKRGFLGPSKKEPTDSHTIRNSRSHVVVMAGRWIMYDNGGWDFKIDNERMGRAVDFSQIKGVNGLKDSILAAYGAAPVEIATTTVYKIFKALHRTNKSFNVFVTFGEIVGEKMIFLRSERDILSQMNASLGMDDDEYLIRQVEAVEASFGLNSQTAERVQGSKDKDSGAAVDAVCGVNPASDEDDDFDGCPPKGGRGGRSGRNGYERSGVTEVRGQGSGRGQRSRATGGSSSSKQRCNMKHYEDNTDQVRDFVCTSRMVDFSYTKDSDIGGSVDVVHVTPPKDRNQQNHDDDSVDHRFIKSSSETVRCALTFATGNSDVGNVVLVTPPQQNEKHRRVIEDDDEYFDPPLTDTTRLYGHSCVYLPN